MMIQMGINPCDIYMVNRIVNLLTRRIINFLIINCSFSTFRTLFSSLHQFNAIHFLFRVAEKFYRIA